MLFQSQAAAVTPSSQFTFTDADGNDIPLDVETLPYGAAFFRAPIELEPGTYTLGYPASCNPDVQAQATVEVTDTAVDPSSLGELAVTYEPYCDGATMQDGDSVVPKPYPPPVTATITFSDEATPYTPFIDIDVSSDAGDTWWSALVGTEVSMPVSAEHPSNCGPHSPTTPAELTVTVNATIVDGPTLPPLSGTVDVTCAECPVPATAGAGGGASTSSSAGADNHDVVVSHGPGCACTTTTGRRGRHGALTLLALVTVVALRRRHAVRQRAPRPFTGP